MYLFCSFGERCLLRPASYLDAKRQAGRNGKWAIDMVHIVDTHVGKRIRQRRWMIAMTQQALADRVGIKFQQIQKYETGANRVSASRLWDIANAMDVPVGFFFQGVSEIEDAQKDVLSGLMVEKEVVELVRAYYAIPQSQRRRLIDLGRVLSEIA